jgi:hypothetical protein
MHPPKVITRKPLTALLVASLCGLVSGGCRDLGLRDNIPLAEAEIRPPRYLLYRMSDPAQTDEGVITVGDRQWAFAGQSERIPERLLAPAGEAAGTQVFALSSDPAPYDRLYARGENGRWGVILPLN